jgi:hypothetical protein
VCYEYSRSVSVIFLKDVEVVDKVSRLIKVEEHGLVSGKGIIFLIFGKVERGMASGSENLVPGMFGSEKEHMQSKENNEIALV